MADMNEILNFVEIYKQMGEYIVIFTAGGLMGGMFIGTALEFIGYGVFKALSLLNIKT